jgi:hypothetical protein
MAGGREITPAIRINARAAIFNNLAKENSRNKLLTLAMADRHVVKGLDHTGKAIDILYVPVTYVNTYMSTASNETPAVTYMKQKAQQQQTISVGPPTQSPFAASAGPVAPEETDTVKLAAKAMNISIPSSGMIHIKNDEELSQFIQKALGYEIHGDEATKKYLVNNSEIVMPARIDLETLQSGLRSVFSKYTVVTNKDPNKTGGRGSDIVDEANTSSTTQAASGGPPEQQQSPPAQQTASQQEQLQQTGAADPPKNTQLGGASYVTNSGLMQMNSDTSSSDESDSENNNGNNGGANGGGANNGGADNTNSGANNNQPQQNTGTTTTATPAQLVAGAAQPPAAGGAPPVAAPIPPTATTSQIVAAVASTPDTQIYINRMAVKIADKTSVKVHRKESAVDRLVRRGAENLDKALRFPDRSNAEVLKAGTCASNWSLVNGIRKSLGLIDRASWVTM